MKLILMMTITLFSFCSLASTSKLKEFTAKDFKVTKSYTDADMNKKLDQFLDLYESTVDAFIKNKSAPSSEDIKILIDTILLSFEGDPSLTAVEMLYPLYQKHQKAFDAYIDTLAKKPKQEIKQALKDIARELKEGNG